MTTWNWNPDPSRVVLMDLETQSTADLRTVGSRAYLTDPTTRLMSGVFLIGDVVHVWVPPGRAPAGWDGEPDRLWPDGWQRGGYTLQTWAGEPPPPAVERAIADGWTFAAHNAAGFDAEAWARLVAGPQPVWYDTLPCARAGGLPGGLDALGLRLVGRGKDGGKEALKLLYTAKMTPRGPRYNVATLHLWWEMLRYNVADVLLLERVYSTVEGYGEADVLETHHTIDARGILIDRPLLSTLRDLWSELQGGASDQVAEWTDGAVNEGNIRSVPQVKAWLAKQGLHVDSLNRKSLELLYTNPDEFFGEIPDGVDVSRVIAVLRARQTATRISTGKIDRLIAACAGSQDNRARGILVYHGAHTGRWSGRGFQPHNLAKGVADLDVEACIERAGSGGLTLDYLRDAVAKCEPVAGLPPSVDDALSTLLRPALVAGPGRTLAIVDYASIEARGIAWIAGQEDSLQVFRDDGDPYCIMASRIFGRTITKADKHERQIGKITVLGCIAEGTPILTDRGWVGIESVTLADRVWDGTDWVSHGGVIDKGVKPCVNVCGVWLTPDHEIRTERGWEEAWQHEGSTRPPLRGTYSETGRFTSPPIARGTTTGAAGFGFTPNGLRIDGGSWRICSPSPGGISPPSRSTASTTTGDTAPGTSDSPPDRNSVLTVVRTFDIVDAGVRHTFQAGPLLVHNCGYGMGASKYDLFCQLQRVDLASAGTSAEACVTAYRDAFPMIAGARVAGKTFRNGGVWKALQRAAELAIKSQGRHTGYAGKCVFTYVNGNLEITLPSGRVLTYRDCSIQPRVPGHAILTGGDPTPKPTIVYTHAHGYEGYLYGGLIAENVVQAACRDILATALVRYESEGGRTVLHVHDEIVAEVDAGPGEPDALADLARIMSEAPEWADGFPIGVEGFTAPRYVKSPWRGSYNVKGSNGVVHVKRAK